MTTNPQTAEERVARHLAAKDWLTTPDRWDSATASFRAEYLALAREVIALVQPAASAVVAVAAPPTGQTALRTRIAQALVRATTTYVVEAEHPPAVVPAVGQTDEEA